MSDFYPTVNQLASLPPWESQMHRSSSPSVQESRTQVISSTTTPVASSSGTSYDTNTGARSRWFQLAWKLRRHEILQGKSYVTEVSVSRSSVKDMQTLQKILTSLQETQDSKTPLLDKTV